MTLVQQVTDSLGMFARASLSDDKTETYAFTEIGREVSAGGVLKGDALGVALRGAILRGVLSPEDRASVSGDTTRIPA